MTKIENEVLKSKIEEYHNGLKDGKDVSQLKIEIDELTKQYAENTNISLNDISQEKKDMEIKSKSETISKKEYQRLIELYRKCFEMMKDIREFKKTLRNIKK